MIDLPVGFGYLVAKAALLLHEAKEEKEFYDEVRAAYLFPDIPKMASLKRRRTMSSMKKMAMVLAADHVYNGEMRKTAGFKDWAKKVGYGFNKVPNALMNKSWILPSAGAAAGGTIGAFAGDDEDRLRNILLGVGGGAAAGVFGNTGLESLARKIQNRGTKGADALARRALNFATGAVPPVVGG